MLNAFDDIYYVLWHSRYLGATKRFIAHNAHGMMNLCLVICG